jgi:hypothetical protein
VLSHGPFVVAEKVRHIRHRDAALQKNSRESVTEPVRRRRFVELAGQLKHLADFPAPHVGDGFELV